MNRRHALRSLLGGAGAAAVLGQDSEAFAAEFRQQQPLDTARAATRRGLPPLKITDVREISGIAREAGALLACDNTWATPVLQRPLELALDRSHV